MGKVIMSGIVPQLEVPCPYDPVFENNTWTEIIKACQTNNIPAEWNVGNQKTMTIGGYDYNIDIIGKNHDTYTTGGVAPLTFQMHECYPYLSKMNSANSNIGGWESSLMRTNELPALLSGMPSEIKDGIKEVNKLTSSGDKSTVIKTTADKLFLLSEVEVLGETYISASGEGNQYEYYATGNSAIKKRVNGTDGQIWWERSPTKSRSDWFGCINISGLDAHAAANSQYGIAAAFCF